MAYTEFGHNNRVAVHSMLIGKHEGLFENDNNDKIKDILLTAAYLHDIGRIGNNGPHAKRGARLVEKLDLKFANGRNYTREDKDLLELLVEGHEGKDSNFDKLVKKYKIPEEKKDLAQKMLFVIKDADAVDRFRIYINFPFYMKTDLNPNYLRTNTSKRLLNVAYELEYLHANVEFSNLLSYRTERQEEEQKDSMQMQKEDFDTKMKVEPSKLLNVSFQLEKEDKGKKILEEQEFDKIM